MGTKKERNMTKELAKTEETAAAVISQADMDAFGDAPISSQDVVISKMLLMQGLSKAVADGDAKFGDMIDSGTREVMGSTDGDGVDLIPFHVHKTYINSKWNGKKYMFDSIEDVTPMNENKQWETVLEGVKYKHEKCFNFYCLNPKDMSLPIIVSFKSTSMKAGKELMTQMYVKNKAAGKVPPAKVITVGAAKVTKDDNTFAVYNIKIARDSSMEEIKECIKWVKTIRNEGVKVDNSDISGASEPASKEANPQF